jgi:hypothetical protein
MAKDFDELELRRALDKALSGPQPPAFDTERWVSRTIRRYHPTRRPAVAWAAAAALVAIALTGLAVLRLPQHTQTPATRKVQTRKTHSRQASIAQLQRWNKERILYSVGWPVNPGYSSQAPREIFLLPKGFSIPTTLHHWPAQRFQPIAVIDDPETQIGTGTGTLWNQMQSSLYWLKPASSQVLPPAGTALGISTLPQVVESATGTLFAVPWPSTQYPNRTIFLRPVGFSLPTAITAWPPKDLQVVAIYPVSALRGHLGLQLSTRTLSVTVGVKIPLSAVQQR